MFKKRKISHIVLGLNGCLGLVCVNLCGQRCQARADDEDGKNCCFNATSNMFHLYTAAPSFNNLLLFQTVFIFYINVTLSSKFLREESSRRVFLCVYQRSLTEPSRERLSRRPIEKGGFLVFGKPRLLTLTGAASRSQTFRRENLFPNRSCRRRKIT